MNDDFEKLLEKLDDFGNLLQRKFIRESFKEALLPLADAVGNASPIPGTTTEVVPAKTSGLFVAINIKVTADGIGRKEYGTKHVPAQPFARPVADSMGQGALDRASEILAARIEKELKS